MPAGIPPPPPGPSRPWRRLVPRGARPGRSGRLSLKARLLLGLVLVATLGFAVADVVVYRQIESYLVGQVDQELLSAARPVAGFFSGIRNLGDLRDAPTGTFGEVLGPTGNLVLSLPAPFNAGPAPAIPLSVVHRLYGAPLGTELQFTTSATGGSSLTYRVLAVPAFQLPTNQPFGVEIVAVPLTALAGILHQLLVLDLIVTAAVLALLAGLGYVVVRVGMRPLAAIEVTAGAIAAGDLSERVERDEPETEVGRLGASLNAMLTQIEGAFAEQRASEQRLRQFLADASHELRTPLTSIRGYAELFRRGAGDRPEDLARSMRRIEDEAARMGVLVDDLLLLARLDQGRPLEREPVDLAALVADATADAEVTAPERPISFESAGPVVVRGDATRLRQVAGNLLHNALAHTPSGAAVRVRVRSEGGWAVLEVEDEGPGLAPEHAGRVFERFYRADPSRTRDSGGSGLGLAIVASLAAAHGGRASVASPPGHGACFKVEIPLAEVSGPGDAPEVLEVRGVVEASERPVVPLDHEDRDRGVVDAGEGEVPGSGGRSEHARDRDGVREGGDTSTGVLLGDAGDRGRRPLP